ncbi:MAG TPA: hypothetical protein VMW80_00750 [Candidatus Dormibacteraeota bacterium]|nr:hypothetical protein [Candidatus Dormibacteraeota bacterium]
MVTDDSGRWYHYDVDGLAGLRSRVRLPELELFRVPHIEKPDILITVRPRVSGRASSAMVGPRYSYREWGGSVTANFDIELGSPTQVVAAPLLALSRHVLYTNVVEPLLRFVIASRGRMLLHAGCISLFGHGVLMSAKTDTGKTATILRLLRDCGGTFLSDDMTIISAEGVATRYPKPMTISAHTLRAVPHQRLRLTERAALSVQSRLHSRSGRGVGKWLGQQPVPIMALNSLVQAVIPPPKYMVDRLVPCEFGREQVIERLFLIERGLPAATAPVGQEEAIAQLISNTADAYEFPPFRTMAPQLRVAGLDFTQVQQVEREVLRSALSKIEIVRMRVADFSWPVLVKASLDDSAELVGAIGGPARIPEVPVAAAPGPRVVAREA